MTTIPTGIAVTSETEAELTTPRGHRLALTGLLEQTAPAVAKSGRLYAPSDAGGEPLQVSGSASTMEYTVNAGVAAIGRTGQGVYLLGNPEEETFATSAAPGTPGQTRIDRIYIAQPDPELSDTGVARVDVAVGVAGTPGALPDLPAGAMELARKVIAYGATNTDSGAAFTDVAPIVRANASVAAGGVGTTELADGAVTNAKLAGTGLSASKITTGTLPSSVTSNANHTGKIKGADYYLQVADPGAGSVAEGSLWDSWTP
jgi:hypothetical protein